MFFPHTLTRRRAVLSTVTFGAALCMTKGLYAELLTETAAMAEGPFYPDRLPLDTDNDLLSINDSITPAVGQVTHLSGRLLNAQGDPIRNALIEIWQCDNNGAYLHSRSGNAQNRDAHFQGYGRFLTDREGRYYFRTIKPVAYPGRTPHIHYAVSQRNRRLLTTQMLIKGEPANERDGLFRRIQGEKQRSSLLAEFKPLADAPAGQLAATFDLVLGHTPDEDAVTNKG